jgi:hypothetical protein
VRWRALERRWRRLRVVLEARWRASGSRYRGLRRLL